MTEKQKLGFDAYGRQCIINMLLSPEAISSEEIRKAIKKVASPRFADQEKTQQFIKQLNLMGKIFAANYIAEITG
jgi:hypothetical protein